MSNEEYVPICFDCKHYGSLGVPAGHCRKITEEAHLGGTGDIKLTSLYVFPTFCCKLFEPDEFTGPNGKFKIKTHA